MKIRKHKQITQHGSLRKAFDFIDMGRTTIPFPYDLLRGIGADYNVTRCKNIVNVVHIVVDKTHYYGESRNPLQALRRVIRNVCEAS